MFHGLGVKHETRLEQPHSCYPPCLQCAIDGGGGYSKFHRNRTLFQSLSGQRKNLVVAHIIQLSGNPSGLRQLGAEWGGIITHQATSFFKVNLKLRPIARVRVFGVTQRDNRIQNILTA